MNFEAVEAWRKRHNISRNLAYLTPGVFQGDARGPVTVVDYNERADVIV